MVPVFSLTVALGPKSQGWRIPGAIQNRPVKDAAGDKLVVIYSAVKRAAGDGAKCKVVHLAGDGATGDGAVVGKDPA